MTLLRCPPRPRNGVLALLSCRGGTKARASAATSADAEGGAPFGSASSYNSSIGKWVVLAGTDHSGTWKYVEPQ
jgi:hypothetical protein